MKACPQCGRLYPDEGGFCPVDGSALNRATQVPVAGDPDDPRIGQLIAQRYQLRRVVADGGMGRVYEALDLHDGGNVAIKILHAEVANDMVSVERFKREFAVSKELPHDYIVDVRDFQPTSDSTYGLVMEFLYGEELRATLKREGVISPARVVRMLSQVAIGLDKAHAGKLVHRDLKPDNLFLCQTTDGDIVKILDFGSVKDKADTAKKLTVLGTTIGSPFYMAPEQAQGLETLDHRADVWAMAAIIYECVTGEVPFKGNNGPSILLQILTKEPQPPSNVGQGKKYVVPPTLDHVMLHAFKKMPAMRIPSMGALADAVGMAYGMSGTHLEWAVMRETELGERIEAKLPELMAADGGATRPNIADSFFGESAALGDVSDPFASGAARAAAPALASAMPITSPMASVRTEDLAAAGVPRKGLPLLFLVAGGALMLGVLLAIALFMLR